MILAVLSCKFVTWFRISRDAIYFLFFIGSEMVAVNLAVGAVIRSYYIWSEESPDATFLNTQADLAFPEITPQSVGIFESTIPLRILYPP